MLIGNFLPLTERVYKGSFVIVGGDKYTSSLADTLSDDFQKKAQAYKEKVSFISFPFSFENSSVPKISMR